jgi:hypothetical protein
VLRNSRFFATNPIGLAGALIDCIAPIINEPKADWRWIYEPNGLPAPVYKAMHPMGYYIVADYLEKHQSNPIEAINVPWRAFWEAFTSP